MVHYSPSIVIGNGKEGLRYLESVDVKYTDWLFNFLRNMGLKLENMHHGFHPREVIRIYNDKTMVLLYNTGIIKGELSSVFKFINKHYKNDNNKK